MTAEKREEIISLLAEINLSEICAELKISRVTLWRTINGKAKKSTVKSRKELIAVIDRAKEKKAEADQELENLLS